MSRATSIDEVRVEMLVRIQTGVSAWRKVERVTGDRHIPRKWKG